MANTRAATCGRRAMCLEDILKYEWLHHEDCAEPKLIRFLGRPGELTPKAGGDTMGDPTHHVFDFCFGRKKTGRFHDFM